MGFFSNFNFLYIMGLFLGFIPRWTRVNERPVNYATDREGKE